MDEVDKVDGVDVRNEVVPLHEISCTWATRAGKTTLMDATVPDGPPVVHLVDDDAAFLRALARLLTAEGHVVQSFASATEFLEGREPEARGCLVTELEMPGTNGLELQAAVKAEANPLAVIFLSAQGSIETAVHAMKEGAVDFLTKPCRKANLLAAIQRALAHDLEAYAKRRQEREIRARVASLTPREREVLEQVVAGNLNKEIASSLGISERTIKAHRAHIMEKLAARSAAELGSFARRMEERAENEAPENGRGVLASVSAM